MNPDRYVVVGNPVAHSRSPQIQAAFARQTGQAIEYGRLQCEPDGFAAAVHGFAAGGGRGCNVTVPFKFEALALAARCSERASLAGAANVLCLDGAHWFADNTDGVGLVRDIEMGAGVALAGRRVLLLGAGGAAAGVLGPLIAARPSAMVVANRSADRARALVERHADWAARHRVALATAAPQAPGRGFDVVVNATAGSLQGVALPLPRGTCGEGGLVLDLMYGDAATPFLADAAASGAVTRDGLGMLVEQAAEAFAIWRGVRPLTAPVLEALRAAAGAR